MSDSDKIVETSAFGRIKVFCPCDACGENEPEPDEYLCPPCKARAKARALGETS
jgi:hypothetical protein